MSRFWMVRAGRSGYVAEDFERVGCVAIGWGGAGDLTPVDSLDAMKALIKTSFPDNSPQQIRASAGMAWKFRGEMTPGDRVVTYDPSARQYLIGTVDGDYLGKRSLGDSVPVECDDDVAIGEWLEDAAQVVSARRTWPATDSSMAVVW